MRCQSIIQVKLLGVVVIAMIITGCSTGYRIHRANGVETLYHLDDGGAKRIVYVVHDDGSLKIHDENDPLIQQFFEDLSKNEDMALYDADAIKTEKSTQEKGLETQKLIRIGRIKAAKKRGETDPIYVAVHDTQLGPVLSRSIGSVDKTRNRISQLVAEEMNTDRIIRIAGSSADVEIKFKSYFKETAALNIKTHKRVPVKAFHFEAHVQSNYLPEDSRTITGLGHWMEFRQVIKATVCRVNRYIKERIGSNIPKNREPFI